MALRFEKSARELDRPYGRQRPPESGVCRVLIIRERPLERPHRRDVYERAREGGRLLSAQSRQVENRAAPDSRPGASREISAAHTLLGVCPVGRSSSSQLITQSTSERPLFQKGVSALVALNLQVNYPSAGETRFECVCAPTSSEAWGVF